MGIRPPLRPLRTEDDYKAALSEVSACFDTEPATGTPDGDRFWKLHEKLGIPAECPIQPQKMDLAA